jgi:predicted DNA binding protein
MMAKGRQGNPTHIGLKGTDNPRVKLTDDEIRAIRSAYKPRPGGRPKVGVDYGPSVRDLAEQYGVASSLIHRIVKREVWKHLD